MGKIQEATVQVTKVSDSSVVAFGSLMEKSKEKSRRLQTYRIKDTPVAISRLTFSKDFYLAEIKVYGGKFSSSINDRIK